MRALEVALIARWALFVNFPDVSILTAPAGETLLALWACELRLGLSRSLHRVDPITMIDCLSATLSLYKLSLAVRS